MAFSAGNAQHIGSRSQQQDAFGFSDPAEQEFVAHAGFLGIVADGVGGLTHGSEASQSAVRAFLQAYRLKSPEESIVSALSRCLGEANAAVLRVAGGPSAEGAGTTLVAAVLHTHALYWISAGDSRIYLMRAGKLTLVTSDHTYARQLDEQAAQGKISLSEAQSHSERGSLTSFLGQEEPKEVDRNLHPLPLQPDDVVIACSDGFYRALDDAEILAAFQSDLQRGCDALVSQVLAKQRNGQDNLTVIALKQGRKTQKTKAGAAPGRTRLSSYLTPIAAVALISTAVGFWYEKRSGKERQVQPPATTTGNHSVPAQGSGIDTRPPEIIPPPVPPPKMAAPAKHSQPRPVQQPKKRKPSSSEKDQASVQSSSRKIDDKRPAMPPPDTEEPSESKALDGTPAVQTTPSPDETTPENQKPSSQTPAPPKDETPPPAVPPGTDEKKLDDPHSLTSFMTTRMATSRRDGKPCHS